MEPLVIVGVGGLGKEVAFLLRRQKKYRLLGFVDDYNFESSDTFLGMPLLGKIDFLIKSKIDINVVIGIADPVAKKKIYEKLSNYYWIKFPTIIDETALIGINVKYGMGNIFMANSTYTADIIIGDFNLINIGSTIGHDVRIGSFNSIFPSVNISGKVQIADCVQLGVGTKIIPNLTIGNNSITGAGTVVLNDIKSDKKVVGVPARVIGSWD